jgi:hypothetical protein
MTTTTTAAATVKVTATSSTDAIDTINASMSVEDMDTALFGSLNAEIADALTERIQAALAGTVQTLPLMDSGTTATADTTTDADAATTSQGTSSTREEVLLASLHKAYWRNVDVFEVYSQRNIFSLGMYPSQQRRAQIADLYLHGDRDGVLAAAQEEIANSPPDAATAVTTSSNSSINNNIIIQPVAYPEKSQIPNAAQVQELRDEIAALRVQLRHVQSEKAAHRKQLREVEVAEQLADMAGHSLQEHVAVLGSVHESVTAAVVGTQGLQALHGQGTQLLHDLQEEKRQRSANSDSGGDDNSNGGATAVDVSLMPLPKKKKSLNLHERYEAKRQALSNAENLAKVYQMLQE